jgi:hypothetical protein
MNISSPSHALGSGAKSIPKPVLRKVLNEVAPVKAMEMLVQRMKKPRVSAEFLRSSGNRANRGSARLKVVH